MTLMIPLDDDGTYSSRGCNQTCLRCPNSLYVCGLRVARPPAAIHPVFILFRLTQAVVVRQ